MAKHRTIGEYDPQREDWTSYFERLLEYFTANDVDGANKKRAILLSVVGAQTYQLIRNLVVPGKPTEQSFADLVKLVKGHYQPTPLVIVQRFKFNSRTQLQRESIATFIAELRRVSEHCGYGDSLNDMLRDRLVCGITNSQLQKRLLSEPDLTFKKALSLAQALESSEQGSQYLQQQQQKHAPNQVNKLDHRRRPPPPAAAIPGKPCYRCGGPHSSARCCFKEASCHLCKKTGHIAKMCCSSQTSSQKQTAKQEATSPQQKNYRQNNSTHQVERGRSSSPEDLTDNPYELFNLQGTSGKPYSIKIQVNQTELQMEIDTGAALSLISEKTFKTQWSSKNQPKLNSSKVKLQTYTKERIDVLGSITVEVTYKGQNKSLPLLVVGGEGPSLLGRDWLTELKLDWRELYLIHKSLFLQEILKNHAPVFKEELGEARGITAKLHVNDNVKPCFYRARAVPHVLKVKVEYALQQLMDQKVIEPVSMSDWAAPIVPVLKPDGSIRICGDYKITINKAAKQDVYPLPRVEDLFAILAGGKSFTKLDLAHAYTQIPLDESSKQYVTITTHKGLFRYNQLPFGVSAAPSIFQRIMEGLLQGIPHVSIYLDDILVTGTSEAVHLAIINKGSQLLKRSRI